MDTGATNEPAVATMGLLLRQYYSDCCDYTNHSSRDHSLISCDYLSVADQLPIPLLVSASPSTAHRPLPPWLCTNRRPRRRHGDVQLPTRLLLDGLLWWSWSSTDTMRLTL